MILNWRFSNKQLEDIHWCRFRTREVIYQTQERVFHLHVKHVKLIG